MDKQNHSDRGVPRSVAVVCCMAIAWLLAACGGDRPGAPPSGGSTASVDLTRGYVLTNFAIANTPSGADVCPRGYAFSEREFFLAKLSPAERAKEERANTDWIRRVSVDRNGPNQCRQPADYPNPGHITLDGEAGVEGFDLDGGAVNSDSFKTCPHREFVSRDGEQGIDNQLWRVFGCVKGYQPGNIIDEYAVANIKSGGRTILIEISRLDDERNDNDVQVGIYSSHDPVPVDGTGNIAAQGSLQVTDNERYRTVVLGKLVDGVLTAGPIDELRLEYNGQYLESEYLFRHARIRLALKPDGTVEGLIGGYWDVDAFFDAHGRQATRAGAFTLGYTCPGVYAALHDAADGYPDPETGKCTTISSAFRLRGVPAFVIHSDESAPAVTARIDDNS